MCYSKSIFKQIIFQGAEGGLFYAAKCLMQEKPLKTVSIMFALSVVVLGHGLRICEE